MLGPGKLSASVGRVVLKRALHRRFLYRFRRGKVTWDCKEAAAVKKALRLAYRDAQLGRCIYCRRMLLQERRNASEHLEHFLDKSRADYARWAFTAVNIALACHACNIEKSRRDTLSQGVVLTAAYPLSAGDFRWLHPYVHDYHENIEIGFGWTYSVRAGAPNGVQAENLIREAKLNEIARIEARAEAVKDRLERLTILTHRAMRRSDRGLANLLVAESLRFQRAERFNY